MPTPRFLLAAGAIDGKLYSVGGTNSVHGGPGLAVLEVYDPVSNPWATKAPMLTPRSDLAARVPNRIPIRKTGTLPLHKPPKISLASLKLHNLNLTGAELSLNMKLNKPNAFEFVLQGMEYDFEINGAQWLSGNSQENLRISAKDESLLNFPNSLNFFQIGRSVAQLLKNNQPLEYRRIPL